LTIAKAELLIVKVKNTYSIREAQSSLPALVREAESGGLATITRHDRAVAYVMGADDLASLIETMEVLANPAARAAIADAEAGRGRVYSLDDVAE
jgi:prevent-host-death family protein